MALWNKPQPSAKNVVFAEATKTLQSEYADALLSGNPKTADAARELGLKLGKTLDSIESDITKAAQVRAQWAKCQSRLDVAASVADAIDVPAQQKRADEASKKISEVGLVLLAANAELNKFARAKRDAMRAHEQMRSIEQANRELFGIAEAKQNETVNRNVTYSPITGKPKGPQPSADALDAWVRATTVAGPKCI